MVVLLAPIGDNQRPASLEIGVLSQNTSSSHNSGTRKGLPGKKSGAVDTENHCEVAGDSKGDGCEESLLCADSGNEIEGCGGEQEGRGAHATWKQDEASSGCDRNFHEYVRVPPGRHFTGGVDAIVSMVL